jgi:uridine kinase
MIGDKLIITDYHRAAAAQVFEHVRERIHDGPLVITVAGESGSGKSETATCLMELLVAEGLRCVMLCQDDFFRLPPKTNHRRREEGIDWVGPSEVKLDLMDQIIAVLKVEGTEPVTKPLVIFDEDRVSEEQVPPGPYDAIIVEGTYTSLLEQVDVRAFIDRDYRQTKKNRLARGRDPAVEFLERVLEIEHREIRSHLPRADVVIPPPREEQV